MQQRGDQRDVFGRGAPSLEQRAQLSRSRGRRVFPPEAGGGLELPDHRAQWRVGSMRRTEIPHAGDRLAGQVCLQLRQQPRLADPRLAGNQYHPTLAFVDLPAAAQQQGEFLLAPNQRSKVGGAQRLEPAARCAFLYHPPGRHRRRQALQRLGAEDLAGEQVAQLAPRGRVDHHLPGPGQRLQSGGEVGRVADGRVLLPGAGIGHAAHHHQPARHPHPHLQRAGQTRDGLQSCHRLQQGQAGSHRPLGGVLLRLRVAEIGEYAVADIPSH